MLIEEVYKRSGSGAEAEPCFNSWNKSLRDLDLADSSGSGAEAKPRFNSWNKSRHDMDLADSDSL